MHVIESLGTGGAQRLLVTLLPAMQREGVDASVAVLREPLDLKATLESAGIPVTLLPKRHKWNLPARVRDLAQLARREHIDILHAHLYFPAIYTALVKILYRGKAATTVVTFHNLAYARGVNKAGPALRLKKALATALYPRGFDRKLGVSNAVATHYSSALGLGPIDVVYNPVDLTEIDRIFRRSPDSQGAELHIILPGRLVHEKGHDDLLQALVLLQERGLSFRVTLAGGGPLAAKVQSTIERLNLGNTVTVTGNLPHEQLLARVAGADIVVVPSHAEGLGITALEALALEKPVVVTAVGGLAEVVEDRVNGLVVAPASPGELATAIQTLATSLDLRNDFGAAGRRRVEQYFSLPAIVKQTIALYESACTPENEALANTPKQENIGS